MKRLLFYIPEYPSIAGIETVTASMAPLLHADGWEIDVIAHIVGPKMSPYPLPPYVNIFMAPDKNRYDTPANREHALKIFTERQYNVIIYQDSYAPTEKIVIPAAEATDTPVIVFEHNSPSYIYLKRELTPWTNPKGMLRRLLHPWLLKRDRDRHRYLFEHCERYVLLSPRFFKEFIALTGVSGADPRLTAIPNPTFPMRSDCDTSTKENAVVFVGRLSQVKRVDHLLEIWKEASPRMSGWHFYIVGDGPEKERLQRKAHKLGLHNISFEGFRDPDSYYRRARILLLCSRFEGWGLIIPEAMQRGCVPMVWNSFSSLPDIITDGTDGIIMQSDSVSEWSAKLASLAASPTTLSFLSANAVNKSRSFLPRAIYPYWHRLLAPFA